MNDFMKLAVDHVFEATNDDRTPFERAVDDAAAMYGVKATDVVREFNIAAADFDGEALFRAQ